MPQTDTPLFTATDLSNWLHKSVAEGDAVIDERVVWGWLQPLLPGVTERPAEPSDQLFGWALELGAIAHENPSGLTSKQLGPFTEQFSAERRAEILEEVLAGGRQPTGTVPAPRGSFPSALPYPDPARC